MWFFCLHTMIVNLRIHIDYVIYLRIHTHSYKVHIYERI